MAVASIVRAIRNESVGALDKKALTLRELQLKTGLSEDKVLFRLRALNAAGLLKVSWEKRRNIVGTMHTVPTYSVLQRAKRGK